MHRYAGIFSLLSLAVMILAFVHRNEFPDDLPVLPELTGEPLQTVTSEPSFTTTYNGEPFRVDPRFNYELYGLVVSYRLHDAEAGQMLHALNKDHLNVADLCVVWGQAADPQLLNEFAFSNGQFTCQFFTRNRSAFDRFNASQLSNNHLLATNESIRDVIEEVRIGDQIHLSGWLAHYLNPLGYERGTSTTRADTGNGACETIFVNDIRIIRPMDSLWRQLLEFAFGAFLISTFVYFVSPLQPRMK
jgi:hypothetical protein